MKKGVTHPILSLHNKSTNMLIFVIVSVKINFTNSNYKSKIAAKKPANEKNNEIPAQE